MADLTMPRGDTLVLTVAVKDAVTSAATNITGWLLWFTVKRRIQDPDALALYQTRSDAVGATVVIVDAFLGKISATMPATATLGFADGPVKLVYDVQGRDLAGNILTIDAGTITVTPDVTRAVS